MIGGRHAHQRGVVLVAVLWCVAALAVMAASAVHSARQEIGLAHSLSASVETRVLAENGLYRAMLGLLEPAADERWPRDGSTGTLLLAGWPVTITIQDEGGKIDINYADRQLLQRLFQAAGVGEREAGQLAAAVETRRGSLGDGSGLNAERKPPTVPYRDSTALLERGDIAPDLYNRIAPFITVYTGTSVFDMKTAPAPILRMLPDMNADLLQAIMAMRNEAIATGAFYSRTSLYTIRAEARTPDAAYAAEALVHLSDDRRVPFQIYRWESAR